MKKTFPFVMLIVCGSAFVAWVFGAQVADSEARQRWLRVIQTEMDLAPKMTRTYLPRPYQTVHVVLGAGEFAGRTRDSFERAATPRGQTANLRVDTSDADFLIAAIGYVDNTGVWRNQIVHYIPWEKIIDIYVENSRVLTSGMVR